jgi:hypothetical protein
MKAYVEIHVPGCVAARHPLEPGEVTIGTGPDASIQISQSGGFAAEQLELTVGETGVCVRIAKGTPGMLVFDGNEQRQVHAPFGSEVFFRGARLAFLKETGDQKKSPILLLVLPVIVIVAGLGVDHAGADHIAKMDIEPAALFDTAVSSRCSEGEPMLAEHRARDSERAAIAKQERSAFELSDGVDAVSFWRMAEACYEVAGRSDERTRIAHQRVDWSVRVAGQYASLRMQLRAALEGDAANEALAIVRDLEALLAKQASGPYRRWLAQLRQSLEAQVARRKS